MAQSLYITAMEAGSGKSIVALGFMETFATRAQRAGFFRPIVPSHTIPDPDIELIRRRYRLETRYEEMHALSAAEAHSMIAAGKYAELEQRVFDAYKELERGFEVMVVEGTDFAGVLPALDFDLNASLANQLGAPVLVVLRGTSVTNIAEAVRVAKASLAQRGCTLFGVVVNRVPPDVLSDIRAYSATYDRSAPMYVMTENDALGRPTLGQIAKELCTEVLVGGGGRLQQEVREVRVAAMGVEHFIEDLADGTLVIVPGDRADILLASLASARFASLPSVAGIVLTGGHAPAPRIEKLLGDAPFAVLRTTQRTYPTATAVHQITPVMSPGDEPKIATALGVFEAGIAPAEVAERIALPRPRARTPMMFQYELLELAKSRRRHIVLPEGHDERVLRAADILIRRDVVDLTILGDPADVQAAAAARGLTLDRAKLINPHSSPLRERFAELYRELRRHKGMTRELAFDAVVDPSYFGTLMVQTGEVDGMVSGAAHTTADTIRPAFEIIRARPGVSVISSVFLMCLADRVLVYGDCAVNPMPDARQLADIAISSARTAERFGIEVRIAMLSYSTGESGRGPQVRAVREATELVRERAPELKVEGPIQYDAAVDAHVAALKLPGSEVAGRATVFIFPDLDTGNVAYKAVQRSSGAVAIGPVLQGLRKPINDLSRGCSVTDVVNTVAITAIQGQSAPAG
ncbi:MAG: phosphate acetyltransferase [Solirubrobacterales bacterium]|nr:phosphate acetyltransferase [Solirubrobacterales bacterium]MBV9717343.1 phosphate acetyltransferase [Solirubrobacterales bacterium]